MLLMKEKKVDVLYINPNLSLEGEGLGIADEVKLKFDSEIFIFSADLDFGLKERFKVKYPYKFIDEKVEGNIKEALFGSCKYEV